MRSVGLANTNNKELGIGPKLDAVRVPTFAEGEIPHQNGIGSSKSGS
jgi:hypothetical protein